MFATKDIGSFPLFVSLFSSRETPCRSLFIGTNLTYLTYLSLFSWSFPFGLWLLCYRGFQCQRGEEVFCGEVESQAPQTESSHVGK